MVVGSVRVAEGINLSVRSFGRQPRQALLVHGFADGAYVWDSCMRALSDVVSTRAMDLRGHGDSSWDDPRRYEIETHTSDVNQLINEMSGERIILVGHSLGGHIATRIAAMRPERIAALVLVDFGPLMNGEAGRQGRNNLRDSLRLYDSVDEYVQFLTSLRPLVSPEMLRHLAADSLRRVDGGFRMKLDPMLVEVDEIVSHQKEGLLWQMLDTVKCPTLVVRGAGSAMFSRATAEQMIARLSNGRLSTVGCAGHAVMTDNPRDFNKALAKFLTSVEGLFV